MAHLDTREIMAYVADKLNEEETFKLEFHLADCPDCAKRVKAHYLIRERFDEVWAAWAENPDKEPNWQESIPDILVKAFERAESPEIKARLKSWIAKLREKAQAVLCVAVDTSKQTVSVLSESLEGLCLSDAPFKHQPVAVRTRGSVRQRSGVGVRTRGGQAPETPKTPVEISVDSSGGRILVKAQMLEKPWPLVVLIPKQECEALVKSFYQPRGKSFLLAEFEKLSSTEYLIVLEEPSRG